MDLSNNNNDPQQGHIHGAVHHHHQLQATAPSIADLFLAPVGISNLPTVVDAANLHPLVGAAAAAAAAATDNNDNTNDNADSKDTKEESGKNRTFEENFERLVKFKASHGHCFVPVGYHQDKVLGRWCASLRKKQATIKPERKARLEYLGFSFVNPKQAKEDADWNDNFERLRIYYSQGRDVINVTNKPATVLPDIREKIRMDPVMSRWVSRQRRNKKDGVLSEERQKKLESIGFRWVLVEQKKKDHSKKDLQWIQQYNSLVDFQKKHSHCQVPHGRDTPYGPLAKWVARQRELYHQGRLLDDRKQLLNSLGFIWSMEEKAWQESWARFEAHVRSKQHLDFSGDSTLSRWWYNNRLRHANGQMSDERKKLFASIGITFDGVKGFLDTRVLDPVHEDATTATTTTNLATNNNGWGASNNRGTEDSQVYTVDYVVRPSEGTRIRKKRFIEGWWNGKITDTDHYDHEEKRIKARVLYDDGEEEYLSDEECRLAAIAYCVHAGPSQTSKHNLQSSEMKAAGSGVDSGPKKPASSAKRKRSRKIQNNLEETATAIAAKKQAPPQVSTKKAKPNPVIVDNHPTGTNITTMEAATAAMPFLGHSHNTVVAALPRTTVVPGKMLPVLGQTQGRNSD